jgi:hypothetical protein
MSLLDSTAANEYLTEYEGFVPMHYAQFERKGVPEEVFKRHDTPLRGVVSRSGAYVCQKHGEVLSAADERTLREARADLDERESLSQQTDVSNDVQQRLRDLGYA